MAPSTTGWLLMKRSPAIRLVQPGRSPMLDGGRRVTNCMAIAASSMTTATVA